LSDTKKKKAKPPPRIVIFFIALISFFLAAASLSLGAFMYFNAPAAQDRISFGEEMDGIIKLQDDLYHIEVRRGESAQSVGLRLERAGLISSRHFWYLLNRFEKEHLKVGTYRLQWPASQIAIHRLLVSGRQILHRVTIPEGVTLNKTARILEEVGICQAEDFLAAARDPAILASYRIPGPSMEGYLFPDTYLFPAGYPPSQVVKAMADTFFSRIESIDPAVTGMSPQEINQRVIMASIVEREYRVAEEAPIMAGVFYNRLGIGMALQSCATVEYIITEIQGRPHPKVLYNRDLEIRSPYNTYLVPGLPPGPISAPGLVALRAAFSPEKTEYFYFRLEDPGSGRHYFSKTFDEHIRAGQLVPKGQS